MIHFSFNRLRLFVLVLGIMLFPIAPANQAYATSTAPITQMQVLAKLINDRTAISVYVASDSRVDHPYEIKLSVPTEFELMAISEIDTGNPMVSLGEPSYSQGKKGAEVSFSIQITKGNGVRLDFWSPSVVFKKSQGHVVGTLGLVAPGNLSSLIYGFSAPKKMVGRGEDLLSFGKDEFGDVIYGKELRNVKRGERAIVSVAFVPSGSQTKAESVTQNTTKKPVRNTLLDGSPWILGLLVTLIVCIIILALAILRKTNGAKSISTNQQAPSTQSEDENMNSD